MPELIGTVFVARGRHGDFGWMVRQPKHAHDLFVFNDDEGRHCSDAPGGGNAVVRPYNPHGYRKKDLPRPASFGIPTGPGHRGYASVAEATTPVKSAVAELRALLGAWDYARVYYSAETPGGALGCGIFDLPLSVREFITDELRETSRA